MMSRDGGMKRHGVWILGSGVWPVVAVVLGLAAGGCLPSPRGVGGGDGDEPALGAVGGGSEESKAGEDLVGAGEPEGMETEYSLGACIRVAWENNPSLRAAWARIRRAEAMEGEARAAFWPRLEAEVSYMHADAPSMYLFKTIDAREFADGTDFNDPGEFDNFESGLTLRYNLFNGGRDVLERWMAQTGKTISQLGRAEIGNGLTAAVIGGYYDVRAAEAAVATVRSSEKAVASQWQETRTRWEQGSALKSDVLSLEVRLAEVREQLIQAENARRLAATALAHLMGLSGGGEEIHLGADDWEAGELPEEEVPAMAEAMANRPELLQGRERVRRAALQISHARAEYLPRADALGRVYWDDDGLSYRGDESNWMVGMALTWDLFEGGVRRHRVQAARAVWEEMQAADRETALAVGLDVKTSRLRLEEAEARVEVTSKSIARAEENLALVRAQYEGGAATITRYLEAEAMLTGARMRHDRARFDRKKATANLARSLGRFAAENNPRSQTSP